MVSVTWAGVTVQILLRRNRPFQPIANVFLLALLLVLTGYSTSVLGNDDPGLGLDESVAASSGDFNVPVMSAHPSDTIPPAVLAAQVQNVCQDQNSDGVMNIADAVVDMSIASKEVEPTLNQIALNDLNNDGVYDAADVDMRFQQIIGGILSVYLFH